MRSEENTEFSGFKAEYKITKIYSFLYNKNNKLVNEIVDFIIKDKRRPICTPFIK